MWENLVRKTTREIGLEYETKAKRYLLSRGLLFLDSNFLCKSGEIDLIFKEQDTIVFVEVKYRQCANFGSSSEMVSQNKLMRLKRAAMCYLVTRGFSEQTTACRFDLIAIQGANIEWIKQII